MLPGMTVAVFTRYEENHLGFLPLSRIFLKKHDIILLSTKGGMIMPRGVRAPKNYDEQIAAINSKIAKHEGYISDLKVKRQELVNKHQQQNMKDLQEYMVKNNLGPDEVIAKLQAVKQ